MTMVWKDLFKAYIGRILWGRYKRKYGYDKGTHYMIFPERDSEYNTNALKLVNDYIRKDGIRCLIIVSIDESVYNFFKDYKHINIRNIHVSDKQMEGLMRYAALVNRSKEWTIVSVTTPYDTGASRLLGMNGITVKDIVWYDILKLDEKTA